MSFPSGSTILVTLLNGASPNTGPFDLYINNTSSINLVADNVSKATLSGSGYTFTTPLETYQVIAKSDSTITTANAAILGNIPGAVNKIAVTGSYDSSLTPGNIFSYVYLDNGYGVQSVGVVDSALNSCPSIIGTGTGSINTVYNTLVTVKTSESSSNYIKFFINGASTSNYFYYLASPSASGITPSSINVCIDLSGGAYQTTPVSSIDTSPSSSIRPNLTDVNPIGNTSQVNGWLIFKSNGITVYSGSLTGSLPYLGQPGNAFIELTSSLLQAPGWVPSQNVPTTNSLDLRWTYSDIGYSNISVYSATQQKVLTSNSGVNSENVLYYSFYAVPGTQYSVNATHTTYFA